MKILVTGGAGFIGSNFIRHMLKKYPDYHITNLDKLTYCGNIENLADIKDNPRYKSIKGDIADAGTVNEAIKECDAVVNFAAESHVDRSIKDPNRFVKTNVHGTLTLLKCARELGVSKFVQIGTDEVYGSIERGSFTEHSNLNPRSPYSASKAGADLLALSFYSTYVLPVVVTRSSNNFGPYQYPEKIIPLFITNALDNKKLPVYGDGMNVRDWLYVMDNCEAIDVVLHKGTVGEVYNVSGSAEICNIDLTHKILDYLKKPHDLIEFVEDRPGHDRRYSLESAKIKGLGWQPKHDFEDALKSTIDWYTDNRKWWEPLKKKRAEVKCGS
ncbi:MAG: dTDP-glucose 4,6-dehydratase [Candidatus Omnitrophica bacterium]|nr:dTDP-glucose 4,6-dehydratase [Candidatus Omnitrophota bacterium]MBU4487470.1 dTDP-glucose 4,6-dehydratase [Candidatus Omnitrophota bacterium]MCG2705116.1 dTDP-glucose 4,6-dehydratase [Candidatus Omnitrophota bacterium]